VLAVARASESEMDDGSLWKLEAVRRASCFCCVVVPAWGDWEEGGREVVDSLEKREPRLVKEGVCDVEGVLVDCEAHGFGGWVSVDGL